jgi:hypothetical protein
MERCWGQPTVVTTGAHSWLSAACWDAIDTIVVDRRWEVNAPLQVYTHLWTELGKTLIEETPWNNP